MALFINFCLPIIAKNSIVNLLLTLLKNKEMFNFNYFVQGMCTTLSVIMQLFHTTVMSWSMLESVHQLSRIRYFFNEDKSNIEAFYSVIGWGIVYLLRHQMNLGIELKTRFAKYLCHISN